MSVAGPSSCRLGADCVIVSETLASGSWVAMADYCPQECRCQRRQGHDGGVSLFAEEESCDAVVIDLRGNCPPEENGFGAGENVVYTCSNTGRLCSKCQQPSQLCMVRALYSWDAMLARIRWCRLDKPSISVSLTISVHC